MIDFSKEANYEVVVQREVENTDGKRVKQTSERNVHVNYDFADRDQVIPKHDNDVVSVKVPEQAKVSEPVDNKRRYKFDRPSGYNGDTGRDSKDDEMAK